MAMAVLAFSITNIAPVFAGEADEIYEVKQKIDIEIDCDQNNENEDSPFAELGNAQECNAFAQNMNDVVFEELENGP